MAEQVAEVFTEVIVAPGYDPGALQILQGKKNIRILVADPIPAGPAVESRPISGGLLLQRTDRVDAPGDDPSQWSLACGEPVDEATLTDLVFAWRAVRSAKSNAILLARDGAAVGIGMGQVNRVDAARSLSPARARRAAGSVAASDAFFPFPDGLEVLTAAGCARSSSRAAPCAMTRSSVPPTPPGHHVPDRHQALLPLEPWPQEGPTQRRRRHAAFG